MKVQNFKLVKFDPQKSYEKVSVDPIGNGWEETPSGSGLEDNRTSFTRACGFSALGRGAEMVG